MDFVLFPIELSPFVSEPKKDPKFEIPTEFDFIHQFYGSPDQTHSWNVYQVRPEVADRVSGVP